MSEEPEKSEPDDGPISVRRAVRNLTQVRRSHRSIGHLASVAQKIARTTARSLSDRAEGTQDLPVRLDSRLRAIVETSDSSASSFLNRDILALRRNWQSKNADSPVASPSLPLALNFRGRGPSGEQTAPSSIARNLERTVVAVPPNPATTQTLSSVGRGSSRARSPRAQRKTSRAARSGDDSSRGGGTVGSTQTGSVQNKRQWVPDIPRSDPAVIGDIFRNLRAFPQRLARFANQSTAGRVASADVERAGADSVGSGVVGRGLLGGVLPGVSVARVLSAAPAGVGSAGSGDVEWAGAGGGSAGGGSAAGGSAAGGTWVSSRVRRRAAVNVRDLPVSLGPAVPVSAASSTGPNREPGSFSAEEAAKMAQEGQAIAQIRRVTSNKAEGPSVRRKGSGGDALSGIGRLPHQMGPYDPDNESSEGLSTTEILNFAEWVNRVVKEQLRTELERFGWEGYRR